MYHNFNIWQKGKSSNHYWLEKKKKKMTLHLKKTPSISNSKKITIQKYIKK